METLARERGSDMTGEELNDCGTTDACASCPNAYRCEKVGYDYSQRDHQRALGPIWTQVGGGWRDVS